MLISPRLLDILLLNALHILSLFIVSVALFRWVCEDCQEIKAAMDSSGTLAASRYNPTSFESMNSICSTYNRAVDRLVTKEKGTSKSERRWGRVSRPHLKHILQKCYNKSVVDPNELNNYEAFTPEVYGKRLQWHPNNFLVS